MALFDDNKSPLYETIKQDLIHKIETGTWDLGDRVPGELDLQNQYQVSRGTIRRALSDLENEGYINRRAGKGTYVARLTPKLEKSLGEIVSFAQQLRRAGYEPTTQILNAEIKPLSQTSSSELIMAGFGLPYEADIIHLERLRAGLIEEEIVPFAVQSVYLQPALCPDILNEDLTRLFNLYERKYNRRILKARESIRVSGADKKTAKTLKIQPADPIVIRERISLDQYGQPFEILYSLDRGDKFEYQYTILNDVTQTSTLK